MYIKKFRFIQYGFSMIEMIITLTIIGITLLSLMTISAEVVHHYNREMNREDIQHYANTIMDKMYNDLINANAIFLRTTGSSIRVTCQFDTYSNVYTSDIINGVLFNGGTFPGLRMNNSNDAKYILELKDFNCNQAGNEIGLPDLRASLYTLTFGFFMVSLDGKSNDYFQFERQIFARKPFTRI